MNYFRILWKGFRRMVFAVAAAGLLVLAVKGFLMIPNETGFAAVWYFALDCAVLTMGLYGMYLMGGTCKKEVAVR